MEWISVNDRLPDTSDDVLVTDGAAQMVACLDQGKWYFFGISFWKNEEVTHWMLLPKLPTH